MSRLIFLFLALAFALVVEAQPSRLSGNLRPAALRQNDGGRVEGSFAIPGMTLYLKPSASQQADLRQLLRDQQNPASSLYHRWLTPEEFADRFGLTPADSQAIADGLKSQGFVVKRIARSRTWIAFSGTARQVEDAFHTEIHRFAFQGTSHFANATEPSIPAAWADVVSGIGGLDDFSLEDAQPQMTSPTGVHTLAPDDVAAIYDIASLYTSGTDGTGQKIAVIGTDQFNASALADVAAFRAKFNLPANMPQVVNDTDAPPTGTGETGEAHLDVEWAGAIARNATILFVAAQTFLQAVQYAVDNNLAPVITMSANVGCESANLPATMTFYQSIAQQANAQGITWVNSGSDAGPASCDGNGAPIAENGLGVRFPASIPEVTAVGGTEFNEQLGTYWSDNNTGSGASALSYIPEMVWNDSAPLAALWAGGGGASTFFPKPAWQTGSGVPDDGARDLPDVAFAASFFHDGYNVIRDGESFATGGTSAAAPVFAGILTLLNEYVVNHGIQSQPGLGNVNPTLYRLASAANSPFHDITEGNNVVPCVIGSVDCPNGALGFNAGPGYDLASGLGSLDAANFLKSWNSQPPSSSAVVVSANPNPVYEQPPDAQGNRWSTTITLSEEAGVGTTLTGFTINGATTALPSGFGSGAISPLGSIKGTVQFASLSVPVLVTFGFTGMDASGQKWSQQISVPFEGPLATPYIGGVANAASYQQVFAPGMLLYVAGVQLSPVIQFASAVPLLTYMGDVSATINGWAAPLDYVSPTQLNIQIPYEVGPGDAILVVTSPGTIETYRFTVDAAAPGIFTATDHSLVPNGSGARGDTLIMFITGQGAVSPSIATGAAPALGTPTSQLPAPVLPLTLTIGGIKVTPAFVGIPPALVGTMQINFQIPQNVPTGPQQVVVTVGGVASAPATLNVTQ